MKLLIQSYRESQASLRDRIRQLNELLKNNCLGTKEKECLLARRAILYTEIYEMEDCIRQMQDTMKGA